MLPRKQSALLAVADSTVRQLSFNGSADWSLLIGNATILLGVEVSDLSVLKGPRTQFLGLEEREETWCHDKEVGVVQKPVAPSESTCNVVVATSNVILSIPDGHEKSPRRGQNQSW